MLPELVYFQIVCYAVLSLLWVTMFMWGIWASILANRHFGKRESSTTEFPLVASDSESGNACRVYPGVSILRPLCGIDANLEANITASFRLDYPNYEVILSVASADDPAIAVAQSVMNAHPHIDSSLIIGDETINVNPKINNLVRGYRRSKYDIVWICDSNILPSPDMLRLAVDDLCLPNVGLVHHTPQGSSAQTVGGQLEELFLNTAHAKIYLVVNWTEFDSCVMGKSTLFRKSDLLLAGGLESFGRYIAEDNMIGLAMMKLGFKHKLGSKTAEQPLNNLSVKDYILRRSRWTRIRAYSMPIVTMLEPFTESIISGISGAVGLSQLFGVNPYWFFLFHMIIWFLTDIYLVTGLTQARLSLFKFVFAWILRELSCIPIYLFALFGSNQVVWRGKTYALKIGGTVKCLSNSNAYFRHSFFVLDVLLFILAYGGNLLFTKPLNIVLRQFQPSKRYK